MRGKELITAMIISAVISCLALMTSGCSITLLKPEYRDNALLIAGSTTAIPYTRALADEFMKYNPGLMVSHNGGGSTPGLIAAKKGAIDVAAMSRDLKKNEDDEHTRGYLFARDGVAIVVHPENPLENLTENQVRDILQGRISNWGTVGGKNSPIKLVCLAEGSITRKMIEDMVMKGERFGKNHVTMESDTQAAGFVAANPDALGYLHLSELSPQVRAVCINGVEISKLTVLSERYPLTRSFYYVIYSEPGPNAEKFVKFACSEQGQKIIEKMGAVPVY